MFSRSGWGSTGPAGAQGAAGAAGDTGAAGPTGPQGVKGDVGPAGASGTNGADGAKGDKGDQGERGDIGATGPAGAQGPQGPAGSDPATSTFLGRLGADTNNAAHGDGECVIGQIALTAASISPWGVPASGQLLPISQHQVLFQLLGTTYGGDGVSFFLLPDLRGLAPNGMTYSICIEGFIPTAS